MNSVIISPLFPDVQLVLSETDLQSGVTFENIWNRIDLKGKYAIGNLEVEAADLQNPNPSVFPLSTTIPPVISSNISIFSIDLKGDKVGFIYTAEPIVHHNRCGFVRIAQSDSRTVLDLVKYIVRRHLLLLRNEEIEFEGIDFEDFILKEKYKDKNPYYYALSDLWMRNFRKEGLLGIEITSKLQIKYTANYESLITKGKLVNSCTSLRELFVNSFVTIDGSKCGQEMPLNQFFLLYHQATKCDIKVRRSNTVSSVGSIIRHYQEKAERLTTTDTWKTFFSMLKQRIEEYSSVQLVWPRNTGKTQMAFNLCSHYKVIYININDRASELFSSFSLRIYEYLWEVKESKIYLLTQKMLIRYDSEPVLSEVIDCKDEFIGIFDLLLQYLANSNSSHEDWMSHFINANIQKKDIVPMSVAEFQAKHPTHALKEYVIFLDDFNSLDPGYSVKFFAIILGFKVITTGNYKKTLGRPLKDVPVTKWCSVSRIPLNFIPEISNIPFDKDLLLNRLLSHVNGEQSAKSRFFSFIHTQMGSSFAGVGQLIAKNLIRSLEFDVNVSEKISFEEWRDKFIKKIIEDFNMEYRMTVKEVANTLLNLWYDEYKRELLLPNVYFYSLHDESNPQSLSSTAPFVDFDKKEDIGSDFFVKGQYEGGFDESLRSLTPASIISWNSNLFPYLHMFSVLSKGVLYSSDFKLRRLGFRCQYIDRDIVTPNLLINYSHCSLKDGLIRRTPLTEFIKSYITGFTNGRLYPCYKLNIPISLSHLIASTELAFLAEYDLSWDDALHEAYPGILGNFKGGAPNSYHFDYYEDGYLKQGILVNLLENKKNSLLRIFSDLRSGSDELVIIVTENTNLPSFKALDEKCKKVTEEKINYLRKLKERLQILLHDDSESSNAEKSILCKQIEDIVDLFAGIGIWIRMEFGYAFQSGEHSKIIEQIDRLLAPKIDENLEAESDDDCLVPMSSGLNIYMAGIISRIECTLFEVNVDPSSRKVAIILPLLQIPYQ